VLPADGEKDESIAESTVMDFLDRRRGLLAGVVISGGEPTLHHDLIHFCRKIKKMGYPIKLDTNGSQPDMLAALIGKDLVDYIAMDVKTLPEHYSLYVKEGLEPQPILSSIGRIMQSGKPYEFRTTCVRPMVDAGVIEGIGRLIENARLYVLQPFVYRPGGILCPDFFDQEGKSAFEIDELNQFRAIAEKWVKKCDVRI
jgi:pyruvate formate lyase activating enzyme